MTDTLSLAELKQAALDRARNGDWPGSADTLRTILAQAPNDLGSLLLLGDVSHSASDIQSASDAYRAALALAQQAPNLPAPVQAGLKRAKFVWAAANGVQVVTPSATIPNFKRVVIAAADDSFSVRAKTHSGDSI